MNCKFCNEPLNTNQVYEYLRGKSKGCCSRHCGMMLFHYNDISRKPIYDDKKRKIFNGICIVCESKFESTVKNQKTCSLKCAGVLSSDRMIKNNPMRNENTRKKVSETLKKHKHKPIKRGGNGTGSTLYQQMLFDELIKHDDSFKLEYIFLTKEFNKEKIYPNHYKIDIASEKLMLAIEVDGTSHNSNKVKQWDKKKTNLLNSQKWKVLRLSNSQIKKDLMKSVQMVLSMI